LLDVTTQLATNVQAHISNLDKKLERISKRMHQSSGNTVLDRYRTGGDTFPTDIDYNGQNLLDIYARGDHTKYAREILKILFTNAEMSRSILMPNPIFSKPGLDPGLDHLEWPFSKNEIGKNAVSAKFQIAPTHWNTFFTDCLHRTLTQLICDVRKKYNRELYQRQIQTTGDQVTTATV
ncbi:unnamed protein product, partial [Didymodactylos carnosus]